MREKFRLREKLTRFMIGRYGIDALGWFLLGLAVVLLLLSGFFLRDTLNIIVLLLLFIINYRMFSRNINRRSRENQIFLSYKSKIKYFAQKQKYMFKQRRIYHIYRCPGCSQKIRIPRGKGRVQITCPKCKTQFIKKS